MEILNLAKKLQNEIEAIPLQSLGFETLDSRQSRHQQITQVIQQGTQDLPLEIQRRLIDEFDGNGPLAALFIDFAITEILILSKSEIWFEKNGKLHRHEDQFVSDLTFQNFIHRLCHDLGQELTKDQPAIDGQLNNFRVHVIDQELTCHSTQISFRRQNISPWTFERLAELNWSSPSEIAVIKSWIRQRKNFLVVGPTGSGKTSILNACLQELEFNERVIAIEDTLEVMLPNSVATRLLTRKNSQGQLRVIDMSELLRQALRMRPDRLVVGEVRGGEAKDLLLALSTGHAGSLGTLHASNSAQALIRLEMLIQMGAPNWSLSAIRKLISVSLDGILVLEKNELGERKFNGLFALTSLEENGFLTERII